MVQFIESLKCGTSHDKLDGLMYGIYLGQEHKPILGYTVIVVYVVVNIPIVVLVV